MMEIQARGCRNINLVTPAHYVPQLVRALSIAIGMGFLFPLLTTAGDTNPLKLSGYSMKLCISLRFIREELSQDAFVNIMAQYHPCNRAEDYPEISRRISNREYREALDYARKLGLSRAANH
jgi:uncharacterized Fe-S radical SAM superfamily protein PflX